MPINATTAGPASFGFAITPSDTVDLPYAVKAIYIGTTGNVVAIFQDSESQVTLKSLQGGSLYPFQLKRILATGTSATDIIGLI